MARMCDYPQWNESLHSARKQPLLQNKHKKSQIHVWKCTQGQSPSFLDRQEKEAWVQICFQMDSDPKQTAKLVTKWLKSYKVNVMEQTSQSSDLNPNENLCAKLKSHVRLEQGGLPTWPTPLLSGGMGQNSCQLLWGAYGENIQIIFLIV